MQEGLGNALLNLFISHSSESFQAALLQFQIEVYKFSPVLPDGRLLACLIATHYIDIALHAMIKPFSDGE